MGRVRRYRKIKACDPFAKNYGVDKSGKTFDDPPEIFEEQAKKKLRKLKRFDIDEQDRQFQKQALRELGLHSTENAYKSQLPTKKENESLKNFSKRLKQTTREILKKEVSSSTSTAVRRKAKIKEIKDKKKKQKNGNNDDDDDNAPPEFFAREDGVIRPSDRGDVRGRFEEAEQVGLWDCVMKPPENLTFWADKLKKPKDFKNPQLQQATKAAQSANKSNSNSNSSNRVILPGGLRAQQYMSEYDNMALSEARSMSSL